LIVGGGPAGATAGIILARAGKRVILLEKTRFPRFHIGESFLPRTFRLIKELGFGTRPSQTAPRAEIRRRVCHRRRRPRSLF